MAWNSDYFVPDVSRPLSQFAEGLDTLATDRRNREIGELAAGGRLSEAAGKALKSGDIKTGLALESAGVDRMDKAASALGKAAQFADSPEKWGTFINAVGQRFPGVDLSPYQDFDTGRSAVLAEFSDPDKKWKRELEARKEIREEEAHNLKMKSEGSKAPSVETFYDDGTGTEYKAVWNPNTRRFDRVGGAKTSEPKLETLYDEKSGLEYKATRNPDGTYTRVGGLKAPNKTKLSVGPDGQVSFEAGSSPLGQTATNDIEKKAINASELGSRVASIMQDFNPNDQTIWTRMNAARLSGQAKVDPNSLSPGDRQQLEGFASRKSNAISNLNLTLNELSGAAVSPTEEGRLRARMPDPGTGIFDGDDPVSFQSKAKSVLDDVQRSLARLNFYKANGMPKSLDEIPLNNVRQVNGKWYVLKDGKVYEAGAAQ